MRKFLVAGIQRSGTTLVRTTLNNHPDILCLGEVFFINRNRKKSGGIHRGDTLDSSFSEWRNYDYQGFIDRSLAMTIGHRVNRRHVTERYLDMVFNIKGHSAVGFKLMSNQLRRFPGIRNYVASNKVSVIHVVRRNVFAVLVSRLSMRARKHAHSTVQTKQVQVRVRTDTLLQELLKIENDNLYLEEAFGGQEGYLQADYEGFVSDREQVLGEMLDFIGADIGVLPESGLVRLNTAPFGRMIENYSEVKKCLRGSQYSWCLE